MRKPQGYWFYCDPDPARGHAAVIERDTTTCAHCGRLTRVKPGGDGTEQSPKCAKCDEHVCQGCKGRSGCWPLEMALDIIEAPRAKFEAAIKADQDRALFLRDVFGSNL
jgi:hypothetical protein